MFGYVAGALGHCAVVKEEDVGELYSTTYKAIAPDYRLLTLEGEEFLVEVKNCHQASVEHRFRLTRDYFDALRAYASLFKCGLKVAIYWSRLRIWSLISADAFEFDGKNHSLSMAQCMKRNEMSVIGDSMVGTVPPIVFKLLSHPSRTRRVDPDGRAEFTIGSVQFFCGGRRVTDRFEQKLAWFLLRYGDWDSIEEEAELADHELLWLQAVANKECADGQEFAMIGFLSQMISQQYNELTAEEGTIVRLAPSLDPDELGIVIPADYKGKVVQLWRLAQSPNYA